MVQFVRIEVIENSHQRMSVRQFLNRHSLFAAQKTSHDEPSPDGRSIRRLESSFIHFIVDAGVGVAGDTRGLTNVGRMVLRNTSVMNKTFCFCGISSLPCSS